MNNVKIIPTMLSILAGCVIWFGVCGISSTSASPRCYRLFGEKHYLKAAQCFKREAMRIPRTTKDRFARGFRSHLLRNSAMSFLKASQQSNRLAVKAYYAEQTVKMIRWLLRENLCSDRVHCRVLRRKAQRIEGTILYKRLHVAVPRGRRVRIVIRGYRFRTTIRTNKPWTGKVRPGRYVVEYQYPKEKKRQHRVEVPRRQRKKKAVVTVVLAPPQPRRAARKIAKISKQPKILKSLQPLKRKKPDVIRVVKKVPIRAKVPVRKVALVKRVIPKDLKAPVVVKKPSLVGPIVLLSVAGAAVTAGSILLGVGYGGTQQLQQEAQSLRTQSGTRSRDEQIASAKAGQSASVLVERFGTLETQATTGWVMASSGAAVGVAGMIWWLMQGASTQKKPDARSRILFKTQSSN